MWDCFKHYQEYGNFEQVFPYIYFVFCPQLGAVFVKSNTGYEIGSPLTFGLSWNNTYHEPRQEWQNITPTYTGVILRTFNKHDYLTVDLTTVTPIEVEAIGHFMCEAGLHGQWLGSLVEQVRQLTVAVKQLHEHSSN